MLFCVGMNVHDAELYAIEKSIQWANSLTTLNELWIFTDSQKSIESIRQTNHFLAHEIQKSIETFQTHNIDVHIHWIPSHFDIPGNEKADKSAKSIISSNIITDDRFLSFDFLKRQIIESNLNR